MAPTRALLFSVVLAAAFVALALPASAGRPQPNPLGGNLVKNPGAEAGEGSLDGSQLAVPSWKLVGGFTAVQYAAAGDDQFPTVDDSEAIDGGKNFFAGGDTENARAIQEIDVSRWATLIDNEKLRIVVSADQAGFAQQDDNGQLLVQYLNARGRIIGGIRLPKVAGTNRAFESQEGSERLPAKTRRLRVVLIAVRVDGNYNDAYFDNIDVRLKRIGAG